MVLASYSSEASNDDIYFKSPNCQLGVALKSKAVYEFLLYEVVMEDYVPFCIFLY